MQSQIDSRTGLNLSSLGRVYMDMANEMSTHLRPQQSLSMFDTLHLVFTPPYVLYQIVTDSLCADGVRKLLNEKW